MAYDADASDEPELGAIPGASSDEVAPGRVGHNTTGLGYKGPQQTN